MEDAVPAETLARVSLSDIPATIATTRATGNTRLLACAIGGALIVASGIVLPFAGIPGPPIGAFLPIFSACVVVGDLLTAYLLYNQARLVGLPSLTVLASSYFFSGSLAGVQLAAFPGVFRAQGLLGAGPQTPVWLWMFWHGGFAAYVFVYGFISGREAKWGAGSLQTSTRRAIFGGSVLLVAALVLLTTAGHDLLPPLDFSGDLHRSFEIGVAPIVLGLNGATVVVLIIETRLRTIVQTWLGVAILASFLDAIVTLFAEGRYSVGWYVARVDSLFAAAVILVAFQHEMIRLYGDVVALNRKLTQMAISDGLTGIANRRQFDQTLAAEWRRCARLRLQISLLMMDVDYFKRYNDALGHPAGDECLKAVAGAIAASVGRAGDLAARYGGEEFVLLAPGSGRGGAGELAERIRKRVHGLRIPHPGGIDGRVTISIGIATMAPRNDSDPAALVAAADAALYRAKQSGRDRAEAAPEIPLAPTPSAMTG